MEYPEERLEYMEMKIENILEFIIDIDYKDEIKTIENKLNNIEILLNIIIEKLNIKI